MINGNSQIRYEIQTEIRKLCILNNPLNENIETVLNTSLRKLWKGDTKESYLELENSLSAILRHKKTSEEKLRDIIRNVKILSNRNDERYRKLLSFLKFLSIEREPMFREPMNEIPSMTSLNTGDSFRFIKASRNTNNSAIVNSTPRSHNYSISNELTERAVIEDVLYVLMGIEGQYISWSNTRQCVGEIKDLKLPLSMYTAVCKLMQCGEAFLIIKGYIEKSTTSDHSGVVRQGLCAALNEYLKAYISMVADLQSKFRSWTMEIDANNGVINCLSENFLTLEQLLYTMHDPGRILSFIVHILNNIGDNKGGVLASILYNYLTCGDPCREKLVRKLLLSAVEPLFEFICNWIYDGVLQEHQEFFIALNTSYDIKCQWSEKYGIKSKLIPKFITDCQAQKILKIGKSINFLREVCKTQTSVRCDQLVAKTMSVSAKSMIKQDVDRSFDNMLNTVDWVTSSQLLKNIFQEFHLMDHFTALRKFMLHGQGDFIVRLLELSEVLLSAPSLEMHASSLDIKLHEAIKTTNAQYTPSHVQNRVNVNLLKMNEAEKGWDVFTLRYDYSDVRPLYALMSSTVVQCYTRAFIHLFRGRRVHFILNKMSKEQNTCRRAFLALPNEVNSVLLICHKLIMEKLHFVNQIQYYINFEVLECSWKKFMENLNQAPNLDSVINHHSCFLAQVTSRLMLEELSRDLLTNLRTIYNLIIDFEDIHNKIFDKLKYELRARERYFEQIKEMQDRGDWGVNTEIETKEKKRKLFFIESDILNMKQSLRAHHKIYESQVVNFLWNLSKHNDPSLRCLYSNLNFNDKYTDLIRLIKK